MTRRLCVVPADATRCEVCGHALRRGVGRLCPGPQPVGLGDIVATALGTVGITKERAQAVAAALGLEGCGCEDRQAWMNELGKAFGIGTD